MEKKPAKARDLQRVTESYLHAYYRELRKTIGGYRVLPTNFPEFLRSPATVTSLVGIDGVVIVYRASSILSVQSKIVHNDIVTIAAHLSTYVPDLPLPDLRVDGIAALPRPITEGITVEPVDELGFVLPWVRVEIDSHTDPGYWDDERARKNAEADITSVVASHLMGGDVPDSLSNIRKSVSYDLREVAESLSKLLSQDPHEETIQAFLTQNPILLEPTAVSVTPKLRLGAEHITDFVVELTNKNYLLVEIEPSTFPLFTKSGDQTRQLTHALRQVEDWLDWVAENLGYARKTMPDIRYPRGLVIIGRGSCLAPGDRDRINRKNADNHYITIATYDDLIDRAIQTAANFSN